MGSLLLCAVWEETWCWHCQHDGIKTTRSSIVEMIWRWWRVMTRFFFVAASSLYVFFFWFFFTSCVWRPRYTTSMTRPISSYFMVKNFNIDLTEIWYEIFFFLDFKFPIPITFVTRNGEKQARGVPLWTWSCWVEIILCCVMLSFLDNENPLKIDDDVLRIL